MALEISDVLPTEGVGQLVTPPDKWQDLLPANGADWYESPSSINNFVACPLMWWTNRYSPLPGSPSGFPAVVGTFVHRVFEIYYNEPAHLRTKKLLRRVFKEAWDALRQNSDNGIIDQDLRSSFNTLEEQSRNSDRMRGEFHNRAEECINNLFEFEEPSDVRVTGNEMWIRMQKNGITIRGKIDRTEMSNSGREIITDYKTGRAPSPDDIDVLDPTFIPSGIYALAFSKMDALPGEALGHDVSSVALMYVKTLDMFRIKITPDRLQLVDEFLNEVTTRMREINVSGEVLATPAASKNQYPCIWCPLKNSCPVWTDGTFDAVEEEYGE